MHMFIFGLLFFPCMHTFDGNSSLSKCNFSNILYRRCSCDCIGMEEFYSNYFIHFNNCQISLNFKANSNLKYILNSNYFQGNYSEYTIDKIKWYSNCIEKIESNFLENVFFNNSDKAELFWSLSITHSACLTGLDDNVFLSIPYLKYLDLSFNRLVDIGRKAFNGLQVLEHLKLSNNRLHSLTNEIFGSLRSLKTLELSGNAIVLIESLAFQSMTRLELLKLNRNRIKYLKKHVFNSFQVLHTLDLSFNELQSFDINYMSDMCRESIRNLYLNNNKLKTLSIHIMDFSNINPSHFDIVLSDNPWVCDNELAWMKVLTAFIRQTSIRCSQPPEYSGLTLNQVSLAKWKDSPGNTPGYPVHELSLNDEMIGVIVSIFCVLLFLSILFLDYRYRWCANMKFCKINKKKIKTVENDSDDNTQLYMITLDGDKAV